LRYQAEIFGACVELINLDLRGLSSQFNSRAGLGETFSGFIMLLAQNFPAFSASNILKNFKIGLCHIFRAYVIS
jgi:hypothetical protein